MLELRPNCELCDADLPPESADARICSYECTFCATCVGGFQPRPVRPRHAWRDGTGLEHAPPGTRRRHTPYSRDELAAFVEPLRAIPPRER